MYRTSRVVMAVGVLVAACWLASPARADWPQFLGPDHDGIARTAKPLPRSWPAGGPKVLWKVEVGEGFAGPAICGDSVLLLDREDNARDVVRRLRLVDGAEVWRYPYSAPGRLPTKDGSRGTPTTDGKLVFTIGPFGHVHALKFEDGSLVWKAHLLKDWQARLPKWGVATSPLLMDDWVIVTPWGKKAAVVAYEKATGKVVWQTPDPGIQDSDRSNRRAYSSPVPMTLNGRRMIAASGPWAHTIGVDPRTGEQLWRYSGYACKIPIPSPTLIGDGRIFLTGGYKSGCAMFKVESVEGRFRTRELWKNHNMGSHIGQALFHKGYLYGNSIDTRGGLTCLTLDGRIKWQTRNSPGFDRGNLLIVDDLIFIMDGKTGDLVMAEASPNGYKELGRARFLSGRGSAVWAPLAYSGGKLVVRDQYTLACVDLWASGP